MSEVPEKIVMSSQECKTCGNSMAKILGSNFWCGQCGSFMQVGSNYSSCVPPNDRAEVERLDTDLGYWRDKAKSRELDNENLAAEVERLRAAMKKALEHSAGCGPWECEETLREALGEGKG